MTPINPERLRERRREREQRVAMREMVKAQLELHKQIQAMQERSREELIGGKALVSEVCEPR